KTKDPNAMDIGRTRVRAAMTDDEKKQLQKEGRCFRCRGQGHISRFCPQKPAVTAKTASTSDPTPTTATISMTASRPLSNEEQADCYALAGAWVLEVLSHTSIKRRPLLSYCYEIQVIKVWHKVQHYSVM
ncbi:hypothetical protein H4582DRAFT_1827802, partial [Lactarius indigo]